MSKIAVNEITNEAGTGAPSFNEGINATSLNGGQFGGRRNLIINGAMQVAQRGTSSTSNGYGSVDRFDVQYSGGTITQSQESLSSGSPHDAGFRNFLRATVTSAGSNTSEDFCYLVQYIEAQNMANSGWNYTSSSSYATVQFWVRSSVAGTYYCVLRSLDGTNQGYVIPVTLSADTWTKVTHTFSGGTNVQFNNDNGEGLELSIRPFVGTDYSNSSVVTESWYARSGTTQTPDYTHTWQQTSGATFDLTGVQLEVGDTATPFEHRSYGEELALCQRYYEVQTIPNRTAYSYGLQGSNKLVHSTNLAQEKRSSPSVTILDTPRYYNASSISVSVSKTFAIHAATLSFNGDYLAVDYSVAFDAEI